MLPSTTFSSNAVPMGLGPEKLNKSKSLAYPSF
jgi:hypothetical protein